MASSPSELSLECKPQSYSMLLKSFGDHQAPPSADHSQKLEDFLSRLEEERLKIDAFKRELPLCMQLLSNAVEASRQQLQAYRGNQGPRPVLEEFIPLKNSASEGAEKTSNNISDKANWMTSAQLWSQASDGLTKQQATVTSPPKEITDIGFSVSPKLALDNKPRNGGAFHPFSKDRNSGTNPNFQALPELALASHEKDMDDKKYNETENGIPCPRRDINNNNSCTKGSGNIINGMVIEQAKPIGGSQEGQQVTNTTANNTTGAANSQTHRKARRCWSPDLHRRFVSALQMLGGSQVATPKQIRELMKVDGLTNDEVKSHLQKYRLHTRRPSPSPQATGGSTPQLVVLGGIWVPPEYAAAAHGGAQALYGAHPSSHGPPHYCAPGVPGQEFYAAAGQAPPPQHHEMHLHHHPLHHQLHHVYKATSQAHSSPESGMRGTGDRSESIEDGKSESSSWKGDSAENGGERKGLSNLRDDNEESNGSEITLKF